MATGTKGTLLWTQDFPRADRHFSQAVRRLTRIHVRSVEQTVNLDEGDAFDWPWLYAVQVGEWGLTDAQGKELREYLLRGGFFMADDFHGNAEWNEFASRIHKAFPEYQIKELPDDDPIFHTVYDLEDRIQVVGWSHLREGSKNAWDGGKGAHWRGIADGIRESRRRSNTRRPPRSKQSSRHSWSTKPCAREGPPPERSVIAGGAGVSVMLAQGGRTVLNHAVRSATRDA